MIMRTEVRQEAEHQDRLSVADIPRICRKCITSARIADMDPAEITVITVTRGITGVRIATAVTREVTDVRIATAVTREVTGVRIATAVMREVTDVRTATAAMREVTDVRTVTAAMRGVTDVRIATAVMRMEIIRKTTVHMTGMRLMTIHSIPVM